MKALVHGAPLFKPVDGRIFTKPFPTLPLVGLSTRVDGGPVYTVTVSDRDAVIVLDSSKIGTHAL